MNRFKQATRCIGVKKVKDITDQFDYEDKQPGGRGDGSLVSCGQDGSYNEVDYIFTEILQQHIDKGEITEDEAIDALCETCHKLDNPRKRTDFYAHLEKLLQIKIKI